LKREINKNEWPKYGRSPQLGLGIGQTLKGMGLAYQKFSSLSLAYGPSKAFFLLVWPKVGNRPDQALTGMSLAYDFSSSLSLTYDL
jgi:hypothetical protein